eukprot:GFKZ01007086.1.p1 GENE.GFKZ01007086.1~~GFKZ01007086.1.p1  ORF type:complete len:743 (-),score=105.99 GFKZ01007086.1:477-2705(-)
MDLAFLQTAFPLPPANPDFSSPSKSHSHPIPLRPFRPHSPERTLSVARKYGRRPRFRTLCAISPPSSLPKDPPTPAPDDPYHRDSTLATILIAPAFTPRVFHSSVSALFSYYSLICKTQPFIPVRLFFAVLSILSSKLIALSIPILFRHIIDSLSGTNFPAWPAVVALVLAHALAKLFASVTHELRNSLFAKAGQRIGRSITITSFAHLHNLDLAFHTAARTGALTRVVDRGTRSVLTIFRGVVFAFLPSLFELFLVCVVMLRTFSAVYAAVTVTTFLAFVLWTLRVNDRLSVARAEMNAAENEASAKLTDSLMNVEAIKAFDNAAFETARYDKTLESYEGLAVKSEWIFGRLNVGQGAVFNVGLTINLLLAANDVLTGRLTVGSVVMLATMLQQLWTPLNFLGWQYREVKQSLIDLQNLFDVLSKHPRIIDKNGAKPLQVSGGSITFENVAFEYPEPDEDLRFGGVKGESEKVLGEDSKESMAKGRLALDGLSFHLPAGKSLALVGSSGSGKSTATRLLCRLYDLTEGRIFIDGQDIAEATIESVRQAVSIVPQDTALFNDTIAYNIRYGRPSATDKEVIDAAKAASIHDVIMRTENGYETYVGERGVRLSGGERQRLSVARAFLKGSKIIVEDEASSALDTLTELEVSKSLERLGVNRTRIIVAHRLSTIMNVDHIIVMKYGRMVEEGSFEELLKIPDGIFRGMWERQQKQEDDKEGLDIGSATESWPAKGGLLSENELP